MIRANLVKVCTITMFVLLFFTFFYFCFIMFYFENDFYLVIKFLFILLFITIKILH